MVSVAQAQRPPIWLPAPTALQHRGQGPGGEGPGHLAALLGSHGVRLMREVAVPEGHLELLETAELWGLAPTNTVHTWVQAPSGGPSGAPPLPHEPGPGSAHSLARTPGSALT